MTARKNLTCLSETTVTNRRALVQNRPMLRRSLHRALLLLMLAVNPIGIGPARANLGGDAASVSDDAAGLQGVAHAEILAEFAVTQIDAPTGMHVREFLNRDGIVFAVSWTCPAPPDLQRLLGAHFAQYSAALAALNHPGLHRSVRVASPELVVEAGGHLRAYSGRAFLPAQIPPGVSAADLR